ncbi:MAG: nucleotidyltransferase family protein [Candidatus Micrarchaeota archaeon]
MQKAKKLTPANILKLLRQHRDRFRGYKVKKMGLFGSFLKGKQNKNSDMDFLVEFEEPTFDNYMDLKFLLERMFHKKVDLVIESSLKPALQYIRKEARYV